jgi:hypothetical protein
VVLLQEPSGKRGGVEISHLAYEISTRSRVGTSVWEGSGLATDALTDVSRGENHDDVVTDVKTREEMMTQSINIYNQREMHTRERPAVK